ncbi:MAG: ABC transporter ATP-binding protein, partial [Actinomyces sp.]
ARQATATLRRTVQRLERDIAETETEIGELEGRLADPSIYEAPELVAELADAHEAAKARAARLLAEWERAAAELEELQTDSA